MSARLSVLSLAVLFAAGPLAAEDDYRYGYIRTVEQGVTLQRASDAAAEAAAPNLPFLPGDRVWTDDAGRMEVQFADGSVLRLDSRSKLDYLSHEGGRRAERVVLRLWSGALFLHYRDGRRSPEIVIETPEGVLEPEKRGVYRLDVEPGQARAAVLDGEATVEADRRVNVDGGEEVVIREGALYAGPERIDAYESDDAFARWDADMERQLAYAEGEEWMPEEVSPYAGDFAAYGTWRSEPEYGNVWYPTVDVGWRPYSHGYWAWTAYGWTWVPNERWGWAAYHYGRWGFSDLGWYWIPGRSWGPAWVSWSVGRNHVGWCPLGWGDRPVHLRFARNRGNAVRRGSGFRTEESSPWTYVSRGDMGHRDLARRKVPVSQVPTADLRVAPDGRARPTRDLRLVEGGPASAPLAPVRAVPRNVTRKHTPGDTVPELQADPATTIRRPIPRRHREPDDTAEPAAKDGESSSRVAVPRPQGAPPTAWRPNATAPREQRAPRGGTGVFEDRADRRRAEPREAPRARTEEPRAGRGRNDRDRDETLRPLFGPLSRPRSDDGATRNRGASPRREAPAPRVERSAPRDRAPQRERSRPAGVSNAPRAPAAPPPASRPESRGESRGERARPKERN
jgi:FecR protein